MKKKILVTGGCGYIGSHTLVEIIQAGYDVVALDNLSNSDPSILKGVEKIVGKGVPFVQADCCDYDAMERLFAEHNFDLVIHFAASKKVGESVKIPLHYYRNNLTSSMNILDMMRKYSVKYFLFSSSCTVYGEPETLPVHEGMPFRRTTSPYGRTKQFCEDILRDSIESYGEFKAISLRYFNPIGAHPSALIGELPLGVPNNLLPYVTQTALGIREKLSIFGDDYPTPDGTNIRDYIDINDLARAHRIAVERLLNEKTKSDYEVFNLGTGVGISTLEIVKTFEKVTGVKVNYEMAPRRYGDIAAIWADPAIANNELGWKAEKSLEETLLSAWKWENRTK